MWDEHKPETIDDLLHVLSRMAAIPSWMFRGQANAEWPLTPCLHRLVNDKARREEKALWEAATLGYFKRHIRSRLPVSELAYLDSILGTLTLMQHYGAPTRLLDWSFSPWVAAYFAAREQQDQDGAIWACNRSLLSWKHQFPDPMTEECMTRRRCFDRLTASTTVQEWVKFAAIENPVGTSLVYEWADDRITAQQSVFTIMATIGVDHGDEIERLVPHDGRYRLVIDRGLKPELIAHLWRMNIGALSLFPGTDGVGKCVSDVVRNQLDIDDAGVSWILNELEHGKVIDGA